MSPGTSILSIAETVKVFFFRAPGTTAPAVAYCSQSVEATCFTYFVFFSLGRAWLLLGLNESSMESYFRSLGEDEKVVKKFYTRYSLFRDPSRLEVS